MQPKGPKLERDTPLAVVAVRKDGRMNSRTDPSFTDPVHSIMAWPVAAIGGGDSLRDVAKALMAERVGALLVMDADTLVGIVSERDIVRALAEGADPDEVWSGDVMALDTVVAGPGDPVARVARKMLDIGVRHIPVRDGDELVGMVSMRDVLRVLLGQAAG